MAEAIATAILTAAEIAPTGLALTATTALVGAGIAIGGSVLAQQFTEQGKTSAGPVERQQVVRNAAGPRARSYGRVRVGGQQIFLVTAPAGGGLISMFRVVAHNDGLIDAVEEHVIDGDVVTINGAGTITAPSRIAGQGYILYRLGDDAPAHYTPLGTVAAAWTTDHLGKGVAHSLTSFGPPGDATKFFSMWPNGAQTQYRQTIRASLVWDPRDPGQDAEDASTWTWSDNWALCVLDYLRHRTGMGMPLAWLLPEIEAWKTAADICDEDVPLAAGGTEKRYRLWGTYSYDERPADVLARFLSAANGRLWLGPNGGVTVAVGAWVAPSVTLDDAAITSYQIAPGADRTATANTLTATYLDAANGYVDGDADPWVDAASVAAFGEIRGDARLAAVPSQAQARRLMKQALAHIAPAWKGTLTTNLRGLRVLTERFVRIEIGELGLAFDAEIDDVQFLQERGSIVRGLQIAFTAMSAAAFAWDAATEERNAA